MKQKLFLGALLLGALTLNSCVDDTESASVTAVRQAKAEQLKSIASYNDAQAKALIMAEETAKAAQEAEAALKKAQEEKIKAEAAYKLALADYQAAQSEYQRAQAQEKLAQAEQAKAQAEYWIQKYANDIENLKAQLEIQAVNNKKALLEAQQQYEKALRDADETKVSDLERLFGTYTRLAGELQILKEDLARHELQLLRYKAGLITAKEANEETIAENLKKMAEYQSEIDADKAAIETYKSVTNVADANAALEEAKVKQSSLANALTGASNVEANALNAYNKANTALGQSAYIQDVNKISAYTFYFTTPGTNVSPFIGIGSYGSKNVAYKYVYNQDYGYYEGTEVAVLFATEEDWPSIEYTYGEGQRVNEMSYKQYKSYNGYSAEGFDAYFKAIQDGIDNGQAKILADAKSAVTTATTDQAAKAKTQAEAKAKKDATAKALTEAKDAMDKGQNNPDLTAAQKQALVDAWTQAGTKDTEAGNALTTADNELAAANQALERAKNDEKSAQSDLDQINEKLATVKGIYEDAKKQASYNDANVKAYNETSEAYAKTQVEYNKVNNDKTIIDNEVSALQNIVDKTDNQAILAAIDALEQNITANEAKIGDLAADNEELAKYDESDDRVDEAENIAKWEARIAEDKVEIEAKQALVDAAKEALDKAMAAETPAE